MLRTVLCCLLLVASLAAPSSAQEARDFSSPKGTMKTLLGILKSGQLDRIPDCFLEPRTDDERNMLTCGLSDDAYLPAMHQALAAKFGEEASPLGKTLLAFDQQLQVIDSMQETTDAVNGQLSIKGFERGAIHFVKVQNDWKLAIAQSTLLRPVAPQRLPQAQAVRAAYVDTIREVEQGKFASADEALKALEGRKQAAKRQ